MYNKKKKIRIMPIIILLLIIALAALLLINICKREVTVPKNSRSLVIGKKNLFLVYEDKLAVRVPGELYLSADETIQNIIDSKNYEKALQKINNVVPEKLDNYIDADNDDLKLDVKNMKNIPEINVGEKRIILTSSIDKMFNELYNTTADQNISNENILVDVLNANGKGGYARKTGEMIKEEFGMKYNAANYETTQDESYIIINDISKTKVEEIISKLPEKYFKIKNTSNIPTLANLVIVLGKEEKISTSIDIFSKSNDKSKLETLKKAGYKNLKLNQAKTEIENPVVFYAAEDYFIAYKIAKTLGITLMTEKHDLNNKIEVLVD